MARWRFTFWGKKIGHRQSGSRILGGIGEVLFYALLCFLSLIFLAILITIRIQGALENDDFSVLVFLLQLTVLLAVFGVGIYRVATIIFNTAATAERRSALVQQAQMKVRRKGDGDRESEKYPNIPDGGTITNSPGVNLSYRLPIFQISAWKFFGLGGLCLVLIATSTALFVMTWRQYTETQLHWPTLMMAAGFFVGGCIAIYRFLWQLLTYSGLGPTCIEISDHPLFPGKKYKIFLSQAGRMVLKQLELRLVCREEVTYHQGTDIRTESKAVRQIEILKKQNVKVDADLPFESDGEFTLPGDIMHSFESRFNIVSWMILVNGVVDGLPEDFERKFPVIVYPQQESQFQE